MENWFNVLGAERALPSKADTQLREMGFVVIPGPIPPEKFNSIVSAYDLAVASAFDADVKIGSTSIRITDFVNRGAEFDAFYIFPPLLDACCRVIGQEFKLSVMHARTLMPKVPAGALHVDFARDAEGFPMVGFILMVDGFHADNGATRFTPGSHAWPTMPNESTSQETAGHATQVMACGPAGSLIVYNGAVWHNHSANLSEMPRRSLQGAYIRRTARSGGNLPERMTAQTLARISPMAKYLLAV
jgi:ectoine hydroxylase-related dioxygenase (phytanoyl-CoA dioxygenase family)